jgi:hypothetical protein
MTCLASQRVEDEQRSRFQSGASKRMNDNDQKVPMIPIDMNRKKQYINRVWIFNSCMPFPNSIQSVPASNTTLVMDQEFIIALYQAHIFSRKYVLKAEMRCGMVNFCCSMLQEHNALVPMLPFRAVSTYRSPNVIKLSLNHPRGCSLLMSSVVRCLMTLIGAVALDLGTTLRSTSAHCLDAVQWFLGLICHGGWRIGTYLLMLLVLLASQLKLNLLGWVRIYHSWFELELSYHPRRIH